MQDKTKGMQRQLMGMMISLIIEFLLGVSLTTVINYDPNAQNMLQTVILIAHIVIGVGIIIGAVVWLVTAVKQHMQQALSTVGLLSVLGAFGSGSLAARTGSSVATFSMAVFFMIAFVIYGYSMLQISKKGLKK